MAFSPELIDSSGESRARISDDESPFTTVDARSGRCLARPCAGGRGAVDQWLAASSGERLASAPPGRPGRSGQPRHGSPGAADDRSPAHRRTFRLFQHTGAAANTRGPFPAAISHRPHARAGPSAFGCRAACSRECCAARCGPNPDATLAAADGRAASTRSDPRVATQPGGVAAAARLGGGQRFFNGDLVVLGRSAALRRSRRRGAFLAASAGSARSGARTGTADGSPRASDRANRSARSALAVTSCPRASPHPAPRSGPNVRRGAATRA